jgi:histidinol-phosphate/aromatic aminotransferase/cobyric acid decarboxylase-like protein
MGGSPPYDIAAELLQRHAALEALHGDGDGGNFLSGWQCVSPWSGLLGAQVLAERESINDGSYLYLEDDQVASDRLIGFHELADGQSPPALFCGAGASSIIFTFCAYVRELGLEEVFYVPPLYFSTHAALRLLGIRARPISGRQAFESMFRANWPSQQCVFMICDPIWYAGLGLPTVIVDQLAEWQARTGSLVFVDGSFQYMRWDGSMYEETSRLAPNGTVRLICPTKALGLHGYRCAHAIMPSWLRERFAETYTRIYGSTSADNIAFARVAATTLREWQIGPALMQETAKCHARLRANGTISAPWQPDRGYFVFERFHVRTAQDALLMDGSYFEQRRYLNFRRLNLLSPQIGILG